MSTKTLYQTIISHASDARTLRAPKPIEENIYQKLLDSGFTKREIDNVIYKCIMHEIACKKAYQKLSLPGKIKWHLQNYSWHVTRFCKRLTAEGLVLLKTQFAKKPRNPI
ncbi:hypothetical protein [Parafilimonas sp.]|uniref:hypothetical protein n=1 Tax=Parafilimonas sp. TaxID=1969739 RepID=UPI0039E6D03D